MNLTLGRMPLWLTSLLYIGSYVPYIMITRLLATANVAELRRPLTGLEILPASLILSGVLTYLFVWWSGWWKSAASVRVLGRRLPVPTRWTALSGVGTAFILFTVPLSYTFAGVSIPFMQLLMRGDLLIIAPLVDMVSGRKVRGYSWVALVLVAIGLFAGVGERRGFHLPLLAWLTVGLYTAGYFARLAVMTKVAKTGEPGSVQKYFVEEKIVGIPLAVIALGALSLLGLGAQGDQLGWGFVKVWTSEQLGAIAALAALLFVVSIFSIVILLDKRENSYCVPLERSASILAGVIAAGLLAAFYDHRPPTWIELGGAVLLIAAIVVLSIGPRLSGVREPARAAT